MNHFLSFKFLHYFSLLFIAFSFSLQAQEYPEWQRLDILSVNTEDPRAHFHIYDSEADALTGEYQKSGNYKSLNGSWKFHLAAVPEKRLVPTTTEPAATKGSPVAPIPIPPRIPCAYSRTPKSIRASAMATPLVHRKMMFHGAL